jgi:methylated-DNA-[protein]-cysteine S-methyltransferase
MAAAVVEQLAAYFDDPGSTFELPLILAGTPFQQGVWERLRTIPAGSVRTYGQLARALGTSPRAIGAACRANPCPVVVPCHRVVSAAGWGGFMGARDGACLEIKRWLLAHEGITRL